LAEDFDLSLKLSIDQTFITDETGDRAMNFKHSFINGYKEGFNLSVILQKDPKHIKEIKEAIQKAKIFTDEGYHNHSCTTRKIN
jgi:hypothetical protein